MLMLRYPTKIKSKAQILRSLGFTYSEIRNELKLTCQKSTLSLWCRGVTLPDGYREKVAKLNLLHLSKARQIAMAVNKAKRQELLNSLDTVNVTLARRISEKVIAKIALAMLCLGEASKYSSKRSAFSLGSSDPRIIILFLELLKTCFNFDQTKVRCTVQCRADQNIESLEKYWRKITLVPKKLFYKAQVDPRTAGKPTKHLEYKGVLRVDYLNTKTQLDLESLANLVYNQVLRARRIPVVRNYGIVQKGVRFPSGPQSISQ